MLVAAGSYDTSLHRDTGVPVPAVLPGSSDSEELQRSMAGSAAEDWAKDLSEYRPPSPALLP